MRIISGKFKGSAIDFLKNISTRPLKDSVKENLFNILIHSRKIGIDIYKSKVLDLYSGIGSFGIECISRGANKVTFVEQNKKAVKILKKNLIKFSVLDKALIVDNNVKKTLTDVIKKKSEKYNIFFFDPPFKDNDFVDNLKLIKTLKLFQSSHIVIVHRENNANDNFDKNLKTLLVKKYGRSQLIFGTFI